MEEANLILIKVTSVAVGILVGIPVLINYLYYKPKLQRLAKRLNAKLVGNGIMKMGEISNEKLRLHYENARVDDHCPTTTILISSRDVPLNCDVNKSFFKPFPNWKAVEVDRNPHNVYFTPRPPPNEEQKALLADWFKKRNFAAPNVFDAMTSVGLRKIRLDENYGLSVKMFGLRTNEDRLSGIVNLLSKLSDGSPMRPDLEDDE